MQENNDKLWASLINIMKFVDFPASCLLSHPKFVKKQTPTNDIYDIGLDICTKISDAHPDIINTMLDGGKLVMLLDFINFTTPRPWQTAPTTVDQCLTEIMSEADFCGIGIEVILQHPLYKAGCDCDTLRTIWRDIKGTCASELGVC